jgi:hypothetical protein
MRDPHASAATSPEKLMNRIHALAIAASLAGIGNAFADDITIDPHTFVSSATRAQVREELRQSRQAGTNPWADDYDQLAQHRSSRSRAEVTAGFLGSRAGVAAMNAEDGGSSYMARSNAAHRRATAIARAE